MSGPSTVPLTGARPLVLADLIPGRVARDVALVVGGAVLTGLSAQLAVPVPGSPVPVTGQTFAVLMVGAALGLWRGLASMALYLVAGAAGMPWYADGASGVHLASFGYIIGFVAAAAVVGDLAGRGGDRKPLVTVATMVVGNVVIYAFGLAWLMADLHIGVAAAWQVGMKNYLLGDGLKILLAAGCLPAVWRLVGAGTRPD